MQGLPREFEVNITHLTAKSCSKAAGVVAAIFVLISCFYLPLPCKASGWSYYERRGDEKMAGKRWQSAKEYYMKAITAAGDNAPRPLWEKYNRAFQLSWREAQVLRMKRERRRRAAEQKAAAAAAKKAAAEAALKAKEQEAYDGGEIPTEDDDDDESNLSADETIVTTGTDATIPQKEGYVEILPDGTVKMKLEDYLKGGGVTRVRGGNQNSEQKAEQEKKDEPKGPQPTSFWREPLADRSDGRSEFGPEEKVGLSTVRSSAGGAAAERSEPTTIVTPEYEVSNIKVRFIGSSKLLVTGRVTNKTRFPFHNARVYVRLYNETGVFKGRNWGYLKRGRQTLNPGRSKDFEVKFFGYTGTVGSYKIEVIANFKR